MELCECFDVVMLMLFGLIVLVDFLLLFICCDLDD